MRSGGRRRRRCCEPWEVRKLPRRREERSARSSKPAFDRDELPRKLWWRVKGHALALNAGSGGKGELEFSFRRRRECLQEVCLPFFPLFFSFTFFSRGAPDGELFSSASAPEPALFFFSRGTQRERARLLELSEVGGVDRRSLRQAPNGKRAREEKQRRRVLCSSPSPLDPLHLPALTSSSLSLPLSLARTRVPAFLDRALLKIAQKRKIPPPASGLLSGLHPFRTPRFFNSLVLSHFSPFSPSSPLLKKKQTKLWRKKENCVLSVRRLFGRCERDFLESRGGTRSRNEKERGKGGKGKKTCSSLSIKSLALSLPLSLSLALVEAGPRNEMSLL